MFLLFCCTAAARPAAVTYWNICLNIFPSRSFYYNPNIYPESEYRTRVQEQKRFIGSLPAKYPVSFLEGDYIPHDFYACAKGMEHLPEGGERCFACYRLRPGGGCPDGKGKRAMTILPQPFLSVL